VSLVTACPACGTSFRITPEQLSAHRGDVRCGQCQHIFNALQQLAEVTPPLSESSPVDEENAAPAFEKTVITPQPVETTPSIEPEIEPVAESELPEPQEPVPGNATVDFEVEPPAEEPAEDTAPIQPEIPAAEPTNEADIEALPEPEHSIAPAPGLQARELLEDKPKRRISTWLLTPLALLLLLAALGQSAYFLRTEIASSYPPAKPWLVEACNRLHCTVELPRQADLLNIEDSDLQDEPDYAGVLVLVSALYNRAPYPQAYPLLELTLTDTFDKPVLRRTFTPHEYLPKDVVLAEGIAAGGETHVRLNLSVTGEKPTGYRLYVKY